MSAFSEKLRELRGDKTQGDIAKALGITPQSVGYYEKAERTPNIDMLKKFCEYFSVSADYLLDLPGAVSPTKVEMATMIGLSLRSIKYLEGKRETKEAKAINLIIERLADGEAQF